MSQDTNVKNLIINKLTKEQYDNIQNPSPTELYFVTGGDTTITDEDVVAALGYTPESTANKVTTLSSSSTDTEYPSAKLVYDDLQECADLSNLSALGDARLHALKGYCDEGELLTDAEGLADVKDYAHSTFDLSKFTVTGTPTVTDDGIASGFSSENYIRYSNLDTTNPWNITLKFNVTTNTSQSVLRISSPSAGENYVVLSSTGSLQLRLREIFTSSDDIKTSDDFIQTNTDYKLDIGWTGTQYYFKIDNVEIGHLNSTTPLTNNNNTIIGVGAGFYLTYGSVDLKYFLVTSNGVPVFSGNKTGIDTIKPNNYTVVGSPTISDDGVLINSSSTNYIRISNSVFSPIDWSKPWSLEWEGILSSSGAEHYVFGTGFGNVNSFLNIGRFNVTNNFWFNMVLDVNGTATLSPNQLVTIGIDKEGLPYKGNLSFNGTDTYVLKVIMSNGATYTKSYTNTNILMPRQNLLAVGYRGHEIIDLNTIKLYSNGNLVYQSCLKIPYTEGFNGEKIANAVYRNRVQDAYNQGFTNALYFTLDEANSNFTLPQGEPYGMITRNSTGLAAMPSDRIDTLTLGTSGSSYTAPANGYFFMVNGNSSEIISLSNSKLATESSAQDASIFLPVLEGDSCTAAYSGAGTSVALKFVYAEGSKYKKA